MAIYAPSQVKLSWRVVAGDAVQDLLRRAMDQVNLLARAYYKIMRVSCTIADLAGVESVGRGAFAEALAYRVMPLLA